MVSVAGLAVQRVVAGAAIDDVVAAVGVDHVLFGRQQALAGDRLRAVDDVVAERPGDGDAGRVGDHDIDVLVGRLAAARRGDGDGVIIVAGALEVGRG